MSTSKFAALVSAVVLTMNSSVASASVLIDAFASSPNGQIAVDTVTDANPVAVSLWDASVLGDSREIIVLKAGQIGKGSQPVKASVNESGTEIFNFDQFSSTARGMARLIYDGGADGVLSPQGFTTGVDLTSGGTSLGFLFTDLKVTGSGLLLTVNLYNKSNGQVFSSGPQALVNGYFGVLFLPFLNFTGAGGIGTASNVGAIEIVVDGRALNAAGSDLTFGLFSAPSPGPTPVPEPASLTLLAVGLLGTAGYRLRRRGNLAKMS